MSLVDLDDIRAKSSLASPAATVASRTDHDHTIAAEERIDHCFSKQHSIGEVLDPRPCR